MNSAGRQRIILRTAVVICIILAAAAAPLPALAWTQDEIDKAVAALDKVYQPLQEECFAGRAARIVHDVKTIDLNGDGVDEIMVTTRTEPDLSCFDVDRAQLDLLVSDGHGGWSQMIYRYGSRFEISDDSASNWPRLNVVVGNMACRPEYRWGDGVYWVTGECGETGQKVDVGKGLGSFVEHFNTGASTAHLAAGDRPWVDYGGTKLDIEVADAGAVDRPKAGDGGTGSQAAVEAAAAPSPDRAASGTAVTIDLSRSSNNTWSDKEIAAAVNGMDISYARECAADMKQIVEQHATPVDLNHDGIDEIEVSTSTVFPDTGTGYTACFDMIGHEVSLLVSDQKGGWRQHFTGRRAGGFTAFDTTFSEYPLLSPVERGLCVTLYRWDSETAQWFVKDACDPMTWRPRPLEKADERGSLVATFSTGAHSVTPRKLDDAEIEAQLAKAREPLHSKPGEALSFTVEPWMQRLGPSHDHNGSDVMVYDVGGLIYYTQPKFKSIKPGTVLFIGRPWWGSDPHAFVEGTAFVFKKGCEPAGYHVVGGYDERDDLVLKGAAPVWSKKGCSIERYSETSPNAELRFSFYGDE